MSIRLHFYIITGFGMFNKAQRVKYQQAGNNLVTFLQNDVIGKPFFTPRSKKKANVSLHPAIEEYVKYRYSMTSPYRIFMLQVNILKTLKLCQQYVFYLKFYYRN